MTSFLTITGVEVPSVTAEEMREVDRIAVEDFSLEILQMMENAGRSLAQLAMDMLPGPKGTITILAGSGGNGGGGLCCARHLHNRGFGVRLVLDREARDLRGAARHQFRILDQAGLVMVASERAVDAIAGADLVIDALIGYSLRGAPRGRAAELIAACNRYALQVLSMDVPSGLDSTSGETPGLAIRPDRILTLALPKTGLSKAHSVLYLADIGIPPEVFVPLGITIPPIWGDQYWLPLSISKGN
jgi:NAD(P)H-hydrate epimerase